MFITDLIKETYSAIVMNKARSGLTILGIVIGIGSVIAMVSIGQGAQKTIEENIQSIGSNLIMVMPGFSRTAGSQVSAGRGSAQTLTRDDADAIKDKVPLAKAVAPELSRRYQVAAKSNNTNTSVVGTVPDYTAVRNISVEEGSFITDQHLKSNAKVAVLGPTARDDLFGSSTSAIGQTVRINQVMFTVVGITKAKGGSGFNDQDDVVYVPISSAQSYLSGDKYVSVISIQSADQQSMSTVQQEVTDLLLERHNIKDAASADFMTMNQADIVSTASSVTGTLTMLLGAIAGISLIVGGIGIMNMMLTTVTERTREIGLRKAIGAKRADISAQFLAEATALTFIGGLFGILLGWLVSMAVSRFANVATEVSTSSVALAFGVSATIGIVFGYYPARRAAGLSPIEALRYE
jgi:putative ABC transport system permease protein